MLSCHRVSLKILLHPSSVLLTEFYSPGGLSRVIYALQSVEQYKTVLREEPDGERHESWAYEDTLAVLTLRGFKTVNALTGLKTLFYASST